jgi:hypothetical protein
VGLPAHDARDFTRALRVLWRASGDANAASLELLINDPRTLAAFLNRAGIVAQTAHPLGLITPDRFLSEQRFLDPLHPSIQVLHSLMRGNAQRSFNG